MNSPRVSVLMTAFNRERFIGAAIESVLSSRLANFELIIVDDKSTDSTLAVARSYADSDRRMKVFANERNLGDYANRNRAASHAVGEYLKYLDSDDLIYPHSLDVFCDAMDAFPNAGFGLSEIPDESAPYPLALPPGEAYRRHFFENDLFLRAPGSSIIRREAFEAAGGFHEFTGRGQLGDLELWLRLARQVDLVLLPRDLVWDRQHPGQESGYHKSDPVKRAAIDRQMQREALAAADCPLTPGERSDALRSLENMDAKEVMRAALLHARLGYAWRYKKEVSVPLRALIRTTIGKT